jgi:hypothetical protein
MIELLLPTSIAIGLLSWSLVAKWYVLPWMRTQSLADALTPLLLINALRYVGLAFLIPGVTAEALDARFAVPAAWGDLAAALLALIALFSLRKRWTSAVALVWVFNIFGALDLVNAVLQGLRYTSDGLLGATYFIPAMFVPALLVAHVMIALVLLSPSTRLADEEPVNSLCASQFSCSDMVKPGVSTTLSQ